MLALPIRDYDLIVLNRVCIIHHVDIVKICFHCCNIAISLICELPDKLSNKITIVRETCIIHYYKLKVFLVQYLHMRK